jgi:uncharacterized protein (DUF302 family)
MFFKELQRSTFLQKILDNNFEQVEAKVRDHLKEQGFGILTEIDVQVTLEKKFTFIFVSIKFGTCNPSFYCKVSISRPLQNGERV